MTDSSTPAVGDTPHDTPHGPVLLVANPRSGNGRGQALRETVQLLEAAGITHSVATTERRGHATELARRGVTEQGFRFVLAVGGDGTVNEVVNGLVDPDSGEPHGQDLVLGVVPGGSGCDFLKTWGLDIPLPRLVRQHLLTEAVLPLDLGRIRYRDRDGSEATRLFANIAECGWGADVTDRANRFPRFVGRARYVVATLLSTVRLSAVEATVRVDHAETTEPITEVVVANGQFFGGGMKVAPRALPDDGTFNVQTWRGGAREVLEALPRITSGEHLANASVREW
jgi:diacylglycerol kinase family enzyme